MLRRPAHRPGSRTTAGGIRPGGRADAGTGGGHTGHRAGTSGGPPINALAARGRHGQAADRRTPDGPARPRVWLTSSLAAGRAGASPRPQSDRDPGRYGGRTTDAAHVCRPAGLPYNGRRPPPGGRADAGTGGRYTDRRAGRTCGPPVNALAACGLHGRASDRRTPRGRADSDARRSRTGGEPAATGAPRPQVPRRSDGHHGLGGDRTGRTPAQRSRSGLRPGLRGGRAPQPIRRRRPRPRHPAGRISPAGRPHHPVTATGQVLPVGRPSAAAGPSRAGWGRRDRPARVHAPRSRSAVRAGRVTEARPRTPAVAAKAA